MNISEIILTVCASLAMLSVAGILLDRIISNRLRRRRRRPDQIEEIRELLENINHLLANVKTAHHLDVENLLRRILNAIINKPIK